MKYFISSNIKNLSMNWENMFSIRKMEFWTHYEFCTYDRTFGLGKGPEWKYGLFVVLPKQKTCESIFM